MKKLFLILLFCPLFFTPCSAEALYDQAADMSGVYEIQRALPEEERKISGELRVDGSYDTGGALKRLNSFGRIWDMHRRWWQ